MMLITTVLTRHTNPVSVTSTSILVSSCTPLQV
jgi:hypothetical protein